MKIDLTSLHVYSTRDDMVRMCVGPPRPMRYTGPNVRLGDYYVRELERIGTEHRQVVRFEVVGTGRVETLPRSRFDRQARAA